MDISLSTDLIDGDFRIFEDFYYAHCTCTHLQYYFIYLNSIWSGAPEYKLEELQIFIFLYDD